MSIPFDIKLYCTGLKRLRLGAILTLVISLAASILPPVADMLEREDPNRALAVLSPAWAASGLMLVMLAAPVLAYMAFRFMHSRRQSDFYHALGFTRLTVFISFMAAVLTVVAGLMLVNALASGILWGYSTRWIVLGDYRMLMPLGFLVGAFMLAGFMAVSITLTGTPLTNLFVFTLVTALVPGVGRIFCWTITNLAPIVDLAYTPGAIFSSRFFMPLAMSELYLSNGMSAGDILHNAPGMLLSLAVCLAMFVLAGALYRQRCSETAGKSASAPRMQIAYRCAIALPFALLAAHTLLSDVIFTQNSGYRFIENGQWIALAAAIGLYFTYEWATMKGFGTTLRAAKSLWIVALCTLLYTGGVLWAREAILAYQPAAEQIAAVSYGGKNDYYSNITSYKDLMVKEIFLDHPKALKIISDGLKRAADASRANTYWNYHQDSYHDIKVVIRGKDGRTVGRTIWVGNEENQALQTALMESAPYRERYLQLPLPNEIYNYEVSVSGGWWSNQDMNTNKAAYEQFAMAYAALPDTEKLDIIQDWIFPQTGTEKDADETMFQITLTGVKDNKPFWDSYPIPMRMTDAVQLCINGYMSGEMYDAGGNRMSRGEGFMQLAQKLPGQKGGDACWSMEAGWVKDGKVHHIRLEYDPGQIWSNDPSTSGDAAYARLDQLRELFQQPVGRVDAQKPFARLNLNCVRIKGQNGGNRHYEYEDQTAVVNVTSEQLAVLESLLVEE